MKQEKIDIIPDMPNMNIFQVIQGNEAQPALDIAVANNHTEVLITPQQRPHY